VGYGTAEHHAGLASHGLTPHHRRSFSPVAQLRLPLDDVSVEEAALVSDALQDILDPEPTP
jgi:ribonuclease HII